MALPPRKPKRQNRSERWRSPAHMNFVRDFACCVCLSFVNIEAAHVRNGSGAGMGRKPDDWRAVPLCGGVEGCHQRQHTIGEQTFWSNAKVDPETLIKELIAASPKRADIVRIQRERADG